MTDERKKVRFVLNELKPTGDSNRGIYVLKFDIESSVGVPHIVRREGEKNQVGYVIKQEATYGASEIEKDGGTFSHTKTYRENITPKRKTILISGKLHKMVLAPNENHMFYLEDLARIILESGGQEEVTLPESIYGRERGKRNLGPGTVEKPSFSVKYANKNLERELLEL